MILVLERWLSGLVLPALAEDLAVCHTLSWSVVMFTRARTHARTQRERE